MSVYSIRSAMNMLLRRADAVARPYISLVRDRIRLLIFREQARSACKSVFEEMHGKHAKIC